MNKTATDTYNEYCKTIQRQMLELTKLLQARANTPGTKDYADVGDFAHVSGQLAEVIEFLKGEAA